VRHHGVTPVVAQMVRPAVVVRAAVVVRPVGMPHGVPMAVVARVTG
jgi:hypothetical protein